MSRRTRSVLAVPGSNWKMIEKGAASDADIAFLDLEDAVAPRERVGARENIVRAFRELDWGAKPLVYRINDVRSPDCHLDLTDVLGEAEVRAELVIVPKVESSGDIAFVDRLLGQIERRAGKDVGSVRIEAQIESAAGLANCEAIAAASPRMDALVFGPGDFAASVGMPVEAIGAPNEWDARYPGNRFSYVLSRILVAARAAGIRAIDGPFANFRDPEGLRGSCFVARALGFDGKWCIHPGQIATVNEVFSPTEAEIASAKAVLDAYAAALDAGKGSATHGGATMIDAASVRMARRALGMIDEE